MNIANQQNDIFTNKQSFKQTMNCWHNHTTMLGLTGKISPHSSRYAYDLGATQYYIRAQILRERSFCIGFDGFGTW
ncbi:integrase domain-containing protein [Snodgrassella alvi]|uniref:integrase domain-containing protein n=1 Tax=Snodgrassella alvi TaxID=1196083 RepID=UPI000C1E82D6